jgi:hypothetical protein
VSAKRTKKQSSAGPSRGRAKLSRLRRVSEATIQRTSLAPSGQARRPVVAPAIVCLRSLVQAISLAGASCRLTTCRSAASDVHDSIDLTGTPRAARRLQRVVRRGAWA